MTVVSSLGSGCPGVGIVEGAHVRLISESRISDIFSPKSEFHHAKSMMSPVLLNNIRWLYSSPSLVSWSNWTKRLSPALIIIADWLAFATKDVASILVSLPIPSTIFQPDKSRSELPLLCISIHSPSGNDWPSKLAFGITSANLTSELTLISE